KGQYDLAISDYTEALKINSKDTGAYSNRTAAYYHTGEYDKAWEDVHKAQSLGCQVNERFLKDLRKASGREK
ncbi:MAG: tetratricopeptide repeat protein, partial [Planctomycetota bacterium]